MTNPENFLALEGLLLARLGAQLADLSPKVHILAAADLAGITEATQVTPAVHLVYQGYRVSESRADGHATRLEQTWLATVAVRNLKDMRTGVAARVDAGLIAARVASALMGFVCTPGAKPLRLVDGPSAGFSAGYQYLPLAFVAEIVLSI